MRRLPLTACLAAALACGAAAAVSTFESLSAANAPNLVHLAPTATRSTTVASGPVRQPPNKYSEVCAACHQATGTGVEGAFPPLDGSEWLNGRADIPIAIVLHGLHGEITVKGKKYNNSMMPWANVLSDADIAAVLTYARSSWGNRASAVTVAQVRAARARFASRTTQWTAAELRAIR
jgi:mono/diheme cytochrome c family protein